MIRIVDIETTGVDPKEHRIIEIAAYDLNLADSNITRVGSHLCAPGRKIPPEASAVHHLTDADVADAPLFATIWNTHYAGAPIYAAHNSEFEQGYLPSPEGVQWVCTYKCALRAWPEAPGHSNQVLRYWLGLDSRLAFDRALASLAHRAEPDTYVTAWILAELLHSHPIEALIAWTKEPKHFSQLNFGKHRGMKLADVPADYLQWLRDGRHDMDADWRHNAKRELERRRAERAA